MLRPGPADSLVQIGIWFRRKRHKLMSMFIAMHMRDIEYIHLHTLAAQNTRKQFQHFICMVTVKHTNVQDNWNTSE